MSVLMNEFMRMSLRYFLQLANCLVIWLAASNAVRADVRLPAVFSDHMVLQRDAKVAIWGWADVGEEVFVSIAGQTRSTKTDAGGKWRVQLHNLAAPGPHTLSIKGHNLVIVQDVLVGEVWLASGQSNMEMAMSGTEGFAQERAAAQIPEFRMFNVVRHTAREPQTDCQGEWLICSADTVGRFSGTAYYFGRELHRKLAVPVGIVHSSHGGSPIEAWTSQEAQLAKPEVQKLLSEWATRDQQYDPVAARTEYEQALVKWQSAVAKAKAAGQRAPKKPKAPVHPRDDHHHPAVLFNAMIAPLIPYTLRGAIWYQGESNGHSEEQSRRYATQLPMLINDWRGRWSLGDFPFAWVQLPNYNTSARSWPSLRESMRASLAVTNTGMVVAIDLGSTNTIHPVDKQNVGVRLSLWARAKVYGEQIGWSGPLLSGHTVKGAEIELRFTHCDGGLVARNGELRGFEVAAADKQWRPASARINQDMVLVSSPEVKAPVAVRYAWHFNPDGNLFNRAGLPASPFRTQDWAD